MRKIIVSIITLMLLTSITLTAASCGNIYADYSADVTSYKLDAEGEFKILTLADLHFKNDSSTEDANMLARMDSLITNTQPDLIIVLGDLLYADDCKVEALQVISDAIDSYMIPWAPVFGNHDPENPSDSLTTTRAQSIANKQALEVVFNNSPYCVYKTGPSDIDGYGNYIINITNENNKIIQTLFFLDSGDYVRREDVDKYDFVPETALTFFKNYGFIYPSQIDWYESKVKDISQFVNKGKEVVPSLAFFHIPLPEYKDVWKLYLEESDEIVLVDGDNKEPNSMGNYGVTSPSVNTGMFDKMVELGSTKAVFVGHDHANDYAITYKGITLCYNGGMRHIAYPVSNSIVEAKFGGRVLTIKEDGSYTMERVLISSITN